MTSTISRPAGGAAPGGGAPSRPSGRPSGRFAGGRPASGAQRAYGQLLATCTALSIAGVLLTMLPMKSVYTDWAWYFSCVFCTLPYAAVVIPLRLRGSAVWWQVPAGLLASVVVTIWVFLPQNLTAGVIPSTGTIGELHTLLNQAHESMQADHAPLPSTNALRLLTTTAVLLLVGLADALGILMRRPLLAAAPLLEVLAVASATSSRAASPLWFAAAAIGFLLILIGGTRLQDRDWGPSVDGSAGRLGGARRMAVTGIIAALLVPIVLPSVSVNLLARATHHNGTGGGGNGGRIHLNGAADLEGQLRQGNPTDVLKVTVKPGSQPYYLRQIVLDQFNDQGWVASPRNNDDLQSINKDLFESEPAVTSGDSSNGDVQSITATIQNLNLESDSLPILANPTSLTGQINGQWDPSSATVVSSVEPGVTYQEIVSQPNPSEESLKASEQWVPPNDGARTRYLTLSPQPAKVTDLASRLTAGKATPYEKAVAIAGYFKDPSNGFVYSLTTGPRSDNESALVSFLQNKKGFCQQYAAAAAVLMRLAGLPTRVVLGYTHQSPDSNGSFTVTTADAHAWVEVYFVGIGWIPFDPTPLSGADSARAQTLPWATPQSSAPSTGSTSSAPEPSAVNRRPLDTGAAGATASANAGSASSGLPWRTLAITVLAVVLALALVIGPQIERRRQRRRRFRQALSLRDPEPLWQELTATAIDRGELWPDTLTVGQVPAWLSERGVDGRGSEAVGTVARTLERSRFSASPTGGDLGPDEVSGLDQAMHRWARRAERRQRWRNWLWPRSLWRPDRIRTR